MKAAFWASLLLLSACVAPQPFLPPQAPLAIEPPMAPPVENTVISPPPPISGVETGWSRAGQGNVRPLQGGGAWLHEFSVWHESGAGAEVQAVVFDVNACRVCVLDQPDSWAGGGAIDDVLDRAGAVAGVNGGFFSPEFAPLGLMMADGQRTGGWQANKLLTGALAVRNGVPQLEWNAESGRGAGCEAFLQAGPRLVDAGRPMESLERTKVSARTFVATNGANLWVIGTVRSTTLAGLSEVLATRDFIPGLRIARALNLDGGRSSALHARLSGGESVTEAGWSTVRNFVGVVPR